MQVHKLSYISHGFTLALEDVPLFKSRVEAWKYGPIMPTLYYALRRYGGEPITALPYCDTPLESSAIENRKKFLCGAIPDSHKKIIDTVIEKYGDFSGPALSTMTHEKGTPWHKCYTNGKLGIESENSGLIDI